MFQMLAPGRVGKALVISLSQTATPDDERRHHILASRIYCADQCLAVLTISGTATRGASSCSIARKLPLETVMAAGVSQ